MEQDENGEQVGQVPCQFCQSRASIRQHSATLTKQSEKIHIARSIRRQPVFKLPARDGDSTEAYMVIGECTGTGP